MRHHGQWIWGVVLLLLGGLMLADAMGITLPNGTSPIDFFWPLVLLLAGGWILLGVFFRGGNSEVESASVGLNGARQASLRIDHGGGELKVHGGAAANELAHGTFAGGLDHKADRNGDSLEVRMRPARDLLDFPFFGPASRLDWDVALNADVPTALSLRLGANKSILDLHDMSITDLELKTGASETRLTLPSRGRFRADLDLGAASLEVIFPEALSARIRASIGAGDLKIDESRFPRSGAVYQSVDFDTATHAVDMTIAAGAASIKIV